MENLVLHGYVIMALCFLCATSAYAVPITFLLTPPVGDGNLSVTADFSVGQGLQFMFTQGSWQSVEKGPSGEETANRLCSKHLICPHI